MKNIILSTIFTLAFFPILYAQIVDVYIDQNSTSTTVIEKDVNTDALDVLNSLNIDDYEVSDVVFIKDAAQLEEMLAKQNKSSETTVSEDELNEKEPSEEQTSLAVETQERNPVGKKVKRKRRRTPRWKSDRRAKRSSFACFEF